MSTKCPLGTYCFNTHCNKVHPSDFKPSQTFNYGYAPDEPFFEQYGECQCCSGYIYACGDQSRPCAELGVCGCAYEDMEMNEMAHGLYNPADTLLMEAEMDQQDSDMDPTNDWYPESAACSCCNGYRYSCSTGECKTRGVCKCAGEGAQPIPSQGQDKQEERDESRYVSESANCNCCRGYPYICENEQCKDMGGCTCLFSEEQLLPRLRDLVEFSMSIGCFPETPQEEDRLLNKQQKDYFLAIRSNILIFVDTTEARVCTLATAMVQIVKEFPQMAAKIVAYYKNRIGSSPELRRETDWKIVFRDALLGQVFEECKRLLNDENQSDPAMPQSVRVEMVSALFSVVYYYPHRSIFTLLKPLITPKMNTEVFCLACEHQAEVLKDFPDMWKQILSELRKVKTNPDDASHVDRLEKETIARSTKSL